MTDTVNDNSQTMVKQTVTIGAHQNQPEDQEVRYCHEKCKFEGKCTKNDGKCTKNEKQLDMIQCSFCFKWFHIECIGLRKDAKLTLWPCQKCCNIMQDIAEIKNSVAKTNALLSNSLERAYKDIDKKESECREAKSEITELKNEVKQLRQQVATLQNDLQQKKWQTFRNKKSLLIGDSLIRDIDQDKLIKTTIKHIPGAKVSDVVQHLHEDMDCDGPLGNVIVCVGTNDCSDHVADLDEIADSFEAMVAELNSKVESPKNVVVSSIPPRKDDPKSQERVETLNKSLESIARRTGATFIDNERSFRLADNEINDGYLLMSDRLHLSRQGTNKLAKNLQLQVKQTCANDVTKKGKKSRSKPSDSSVAAEHQVQPAQDLNRKNQASQPGSSTPNQRNHRERMRSKQREATHSHTPYRRMSGNNRQLTSESAAYRCGYCAEFSHDTRSCGFRKPAVCRQCFCEGHKQKFCSEFSR